MGCSPDTLAKHCDQLKLMIEFGATRAQLDAGLDRLIDQHLRATAWDADHWGLDPDRFCKADRRIMETRIIAAGGECHWRRNISHL